MPTNPNLFEPPTAAQLTRHLEANTPAQGLGWHARLPVVLLVGLGMLLLVMTSPGFALFPLLAVVGVMVYLSSKTRAAAELQDKVARVWELAMIRQYRESLGRAWELLPQCRTSPQLHSRVVTVIAHVLGELRQEEAAEVAYGYLTDRLPGDHPLSLRLRVQRAVAALRSDRLADADESLRKLRGAIEQLHEPTLSASYQMARLLQDVRTGHYADAVEQAEDTAQQLKPLGVEAGYGHGLLALCYQQLSLHDPAADNDQRAALARHARTWWDRATLLIPPAALLFRHPDLRPLTAAQNTPTTPHHDTPASPDPHTPTDPS